MTGFDVRPFRRADREQVTLLVNRHAAAVVPDVSASVATALNQFEREPDEFVVGSWVDERRCLVAEQDGSVVAAAPLARYRDDPAVGPAFRGPGRSSGCSSGTWRICTPGSASPRPPTPSRWCTSPISPACRPRCPDCASCARSASTAPGSPRTSGRNAWVCWRSRSSTRPNAVRAVTAWRTSPTSRSSRPPPQGRRHAPAPARGPVAAPGSRRPAAALRVPVGGSGDRVRRAQRLHQVTRIRRGCELPLVP